MKNIWKGLIGLTFLLLGLTLWIVGGMYEDLARLVGESSFLTRFAMGIGFLLIFLGPILFWIILPLKERWYELHPKRFITAVIPLVLFLLLSFGVVISEIIHEPQLPIYSFNTTIKGNEIVVYINRITKGDLPDDLSIGLISQDEKQVDFDYVLDNELKDGEERVELNLYDVRFGNYTLIVKNIRGETLYQEKIEIKPPKYSFNTSVIDSEVYLTIRRIEDVVPDTLKVCLDEKEKFGQNCQEVEVKDEKTLTLKPRYGIGGFSKEYVVIVRNSSGDIIFNKNIVLKPKNIKFGDSIVVNNIKVTPILANYTRETCISLWGAEVKLKRVAKEGHFLVIEFEGKNVGNYTSSVVSLNEKVKTNKGYYNATTSLYFSLQPEEEGISYLIFEIPKDERGLEVYFKIGREERVLEIL